jgi:hypothetical protein
MKGRTRALVALAAVALAAPAAGAAASARQGGPAASAAACTKAVVGGRHVCLAAGQRCTRRYQRAYVRHGFSCSKRDSRGRWRLVVSKQTF